MLTVGPYSFTDTAVARTLANAGEWWRQLTVGVDDTAARPIGQALAARWAALDGRDLPQGAMVDAVLGGLAGRLTLDPSGVAGPAGRGGQALSAFWAAITAAGAALRASGAVPVSGGGRVTQLNASGGGVPKTPIEAADVDFGGVIGDRQGNRTHHGRPWQALCLWSGEVISGFAAQGHPLTAGAAGENITTDGLDWQKMRAGLRLRIGTVLAETTAWAVPCHHNARWFTDGDFGLMHHENGAVSRIYAFVVEPGRITAGDPLHLEP